MPERVPWKDSNLALIGSDLDHKIKAAAAEGEDAWQGLGESTGLWVWRIEAFRVVPWPKEKYGQFYQGDSYIVLNSYQRPGQDVILHDVHIWIGSESSQDEYGTAAYKMVEADDFLRGAAVQHRQTEGHESSLFQSYFNYNLTYLTGGVDSGFNKVTAKEDKPHLYRVKGTEKGMSLVQLPLLKTSLNQGDSFILFINKKQVFVWHGESANPDEKSRSNRLGETMCTQGTVTTLEQGEEEDDFWSFLQDDGDISPADDLDADIEHFAPLLFKLSADPNVDAEQIAQGGMKKSRFGPPQATLDKSLLHEGDTFLLDAGWEIFVWIGQDASRDEKVTAMANADAYCRQDPRTADLPLTLVKSGWETSDFNQYFAA